MLLCSWTVGLIVCDCLRTLLNVVSFTWVGYRRLADGLAGAVNHAVLHGPCLGAAIDIAPTGESFAVEERLETFLGERRKRETT